MSMDRWKSFRDFGNMRQAMDRWMDDRITNPWLASNTPANALSVALDVHETETGYELIASLPGVKPEDVDIQVDRETVILRGTPFSDEQTEEGRNYIYRERRAGSFLRTVRLPEAIDAERVEATLDHGILTVQLPKLTSTRQRRVQVRSATSAKDSPAQSQEAIAATSSNDGGGGVKNQSGGSNNMNDRQQNPPNDQPNDAVSNLEEGVTGYGGEKQGLDASQNDGNYQEPRYNEGGLQARGNNATSSSTSGMSDVRTHQSVGQGSGNLGGSPEGGEPNQYNDQAQTPNPS